MEKVKITRKQADVLETELKSSHIQGDKSKFVKMYVNLGDDDWEQGYPLTCLDKDALIRALYIGYEVEETPLTINITSKQIETFRRDYETIKRLSKDDIRFDWKLQGLEKTIELFNIKIEGIN